MNEVQTDRPPFLYQSWKSLLFLHWQIDPATIQTRLPQGLEIDTFQGKAYLGVVPFYMHALRPRFGPPCPGISYFPELNLRTYVRDATGRKGVWFFSLDAHSKLSVWIARTFFSLPYRYATMSYSIDQDQTTQMRSQRQGEALQTFSYRPTQRIGPARAGSLEAFLVERYRFYSASSKGQLFIGELTHAPYDLHQADVSQYSKTLFAINGFATPDTPPCHIVYSPGVSVKAFAIRKLSS
ncbi:MAG: DUF2071 domain-containing protein [Verrucomicrobiota bacterium]